MENDMRIITLTDETKGNILEKLLKRSPNQYTQYESIVAEIIDSVKKDKDKAVFELTNKFDKWDINELNIKVTKQEIKDAYSKVDQKLIDIL